MEYNKSTMLNRKNGYIDFSLLFNSVYSYEYNNGDLEDNLSTIDYYFLEVGDGLLLPSNRFGTPLAVAHETHCFKSCLYMLKNHESLGISFNNLLEDEERKHLNEELQALDKIKEIVKNYKIKKSREL